MCPQGKAPPSASLAQSDEATESTGAAPTRQQATRKRGRRGGRRRGKHAGTVRRINAAAQDRQAAWLETGRPNETERLTRELNGHEDSRAPEGLYAKLRAARSEDDGR